MKDKQSQSHTKHLIMMLACCLVPIGLLVLFTVGGFTFGLPKDWVIWGALLLMFGAHIFMMKGHSHGGGHASPEDGDTKDSEGKSATNQGTHKEQ